MGDGDNTTQQDSGDDAGAGAAAAAAGGGDSGGGDSGGDSSGGGSADASGGGSAAGSSSSDGSSDGQSSADASSTIPTIDATIEIDPPDATPQSKNSYQVSSDATLTLTWSSTGATSVNISGVGDGLKAADSVSIPCQVASYALVAVADDGTQSAAFNIDVETHDPGTVASGHTELSSGAAVVISFTATDADGNTVTHANAGDKITLTVVVSESTDTCTIDGAPANLSETSDGNKQATSDLTIGDSDTGDYSCEVSAGGVDGDPGSLHIDIGPQQDYSTTTTQPVAFDSSADGSGADSDSDTGSDDGSDDAAAAAAGADAPASADGSADGAASSDGAGSADGGGSTDGAAASSGAATDDAISGARWDGDVASHGGTHTLTVDAAGAEGQTVYFVVENCEDGQTWTQVGSELQGTVSNGSASATVTLPDETDDSSGGGSGDGSGGSAGAAGAAANASDAHCQFRFRASFTSGGGA